VTETANVARIGDDEDSLRFAGQTLSSATLVLITVTPPATAAEVAAEGATVAAAEGATVSVVVNCEKMVVGNMLLRDLKIRLAAST